jgi:hypothetical protein
MTPERHRNFWAMVAGAFVGNIIFVLLKFFMSILFIKGP